MKYALFICVLLVAGTVNAESYRLPIGSIIQTPYSRLIVPSGSLLITLVPPTILSSGQYRLPSGSMVIMPNRVYSIPDGSILIVSIRLPLNN